MSPVGDGGSGAGGSRSSLEAESWWKKTLYLLGGARAGGLKRPRTLRMGSALVPMGRVVRLSCPCTAAFPLLWHCFSWRPRPATAEVQSCPSSELAAPCPCPALPQVNCCPPTQGRGRCLLLLPPQKLLGWEETQGEKGHSSPAGGVGCKGCPIPSQGSH